MTWIGGFFTGETNPAGNYVPFTDRRTAVSESALVTAACEADTDLVATFTTTANEVSGVII
jgi:hypothetical protein